MNVEVTKDNVIISDDSNQPHQEEYKITRCYFTFDEYVGSCENKVAVFTIVSTNESYTMDILDNECDIPNQVLKHEYDTVRLGVYGYDVETVDNKEVLKLRYSPSYDTFVVSTGSYVEGAESPEMITPTQYELYSKKLQDGLDTLYEAVQEVENINIVADKEGKITTITITRKDGTSYDVEILDGVSLENMEINNRNLFVTYGGETDDLGQVVPNIQVGTTTTGTPDMNASVVNVGTDLNPILNFTIPRGRAGSIKFEIVQELPTHDIQEDTIYLVPYSIVTVEELPTTGVVHTIYIVSSTNKRYIYESGQWIEIASDNRYIEYIYVNDQWEELGGINVDVDLSDYYTKEETYSRDETNTLLNGKQDTLTPGYYITIDNNNVIDVTGVVRTSGADHIYGNKAFEYYPTVVATTPTSNNQLINKGWVDSQLSGKQNTIDNDHKLPYSLISGTPDLTDYVKNTDYATSSTGGVIKVQDTLGLAIGNTGNLFATTKTYSIYQSLAEGTVIGKGTLENVIIGKDLTTKAYVDSLVGDVETLLTTLDIGNGV